MKGRLYASRESDRSWTTSTSTFLDSWQKLKEKGTAALSIGRERRRSADKAQPAH